jgi:predicted secreted Zn-dependent protease
LVSAATVRINAKVILPKWHAGRKASSDARFVWGSLSADMKRHEESHVIIAKNHARELENALRGIGRQKTCKIASARAAKLTKTILDKHDREQVRFDRIESAGFERRLLRLMENRMRRMQPG